MQNGQWALGILKSIVSLFSIELQKEGLVMSLEGISHWITMMTGFFGWDIGFVDSYLVLIHSQETSWKGSWRLSLPP